jgi:NAD(P)H dehydrogenase (quinone)
MVGSPVYFGTMAAQPKQVFGDFVSVRKKMENKVGAAFSTSGDASGGKETTMMSIIQALLIYGLIIVGDPMSATGHQGSRKCSLTTQSSRSEEKIFLGLF